MLPKRKSSSFATASDSDREDDSGIAHDDEPWLFHLLNGAAAFGEVISQQAEVKGGTDRPDVIGLLGRDLAAMAIRGQRDLGSDRKAERKQTSAVASRPSFWRSPTPEMLVNLSASSWLKCRRKGAGLAGSSESDSDEEPHDKQARADEAHPELIDADRLTEEPQSYPPSPSPNLPVTFDEAPTLTAQEKVALIITEFGSLAQLGEEERLLVESDATFFQDVAILGVLHLTTHRLTFHASLLNTRPDLKPTDEVLHAGPAVVGQHKGLRRRKRVWMELTHDMITSFRSSDDHDRVRPLRTILLSAFRKIHPLDPKRPRLIRIEFSSADAPHLSTPNSPRSPARSSRSTARAFSPRRSWGPAYSKSDKDNGNDGDAEGDGSGGAEGVVVDEVEFDTREAALGWRREVQAALYMHRHSRRAVLESEAESEADHGVHVNIPLARIRSHNILNWASLGTILQIDLGGLPAHVDASIGPEHGPLSNGWTTASPCPTPAHPSDVDDCANCPIKLQFALLQTDLAWARLDDIIAKVRARMVLDQPQPCPVVDFGALTFVENGLDAFGNRNAHGESAHAREEVASGSREKEVRRVFGLGEDMDVWITKCCLNRTISASGLLATSARFVCFWSRLLAASDVKLRFHTTDVRAAAPAKVWSRGYGLTLQVRGHTDLLFEFSTRAARDDAIEHINALVSPLAPTSLIRADSLSSDSPSTSTSLRPTSTTSLDSPTARLSPMSRAVAHLRQRTFPPALLPHLTKPINVPNNIPHGIAPRHFVCLTIGSRGDVQPYIALGRGLLAAGHTVTIVTHEEYREWIEGWGIGHRTAGGDPGALMKLSVEHKMFSPQFFKESIGNFRTWIDELLIEAWEKCQDADVLIESPSAMAGVHIAEALNIPYFRAFTMPWSKTAQYPHAFISPPVESSARFNAASYVLFDNVFWLGTSGQINKWRKKYLGLEATDMGHMAQSKIPFLYNFSPSVVPKPLDWGDQIIVSGYWFLDNPDLGWTPAPALLQFIAQARTDHKALVYIGFGSITVPHAKAMTRSIVKAVLKSDVRAILSKGWSSRMNKEDSPEVELPPEIYSIDKAPHDWLFPQMDAALHHGGAGTTGASLRAGIPTLIKPWFGDQFFWASRVQKLGAGLRVASLRSADVADALKKATTDRIIQEKAAAVGERIRQEDGVPTAIKAIYMYLHRAGQDRTTLDN